MARVIDRYSASVAGGATVYYYEKHDDTSPATRVRVGDYLELPSWYASEINNGMYRIIHPDDGWMFWWNVTNIQPVYKVETDKCTAPKSVSLNISTLKLTISGGSGGDLNDLIGYGISWRDRGENSSTWGSWTNDIVVEGSSVTYTVTKPASGKVRQFRVRTRGSAGAEYFSGFVSCKNQITGNSVSVPVINFPINGGVTRNPEPWVFVYMPPDPDGEGQWLYLKVDDGEWEQWSEGDPGQITESHSSISGLTPGEHTVYCKLVDANNTESAVVSATFTIEAFEWSRTIASGDVVSNQQVSHRKDIQELLETLNVTRGYYGLPPIESLPGVIGRFADWKTQMEALDEGLNEIAAVIGDEVWPLTVPEYPKASTINFLRDAMTHGVY